MMPQCPGMCDDVVEVSLNWIIWECQWLPPILSLLGFTESHKTQKCREIQRPLLCQPQLHYCVWTWKISYTSIRPFQGLEYTPHSRCFPSCWGRGTVVCSEWAFKQRKKNLALYFASEITGFAINECSKPGKKEMLWPIEASDGITYIIESCVQKWHLAISCLSEKISEILDS